MQPPYKTAVPLAAIALLSGAALPIGGSAEAASEACVAPDVVGVNLAAARKALRASGCGVDVRQLPAHDTYVTPPSPDGRQLVSRQRPRSGAHSRDVTLWVKPLCSQPAFPGPPRRGAAQSRGPAELVAGLYLQGGPLQTSPRCRRAHTEGGTVTISTQAGAPIASRRIRGGHFAIFPLRPGSYVLAGSLTAGAGMAPVTLPATAFTIAAKRTTRLNVVTAVG